MYPLKGIHSVSVLWEARGDRDIYISISPRLPISTPARTDFTLENARAFDETDHWTEGVSTASPTRVIPCPSRMGG